MIRKLLVPLVVLLGISSTAACGTGGSGGAYYDTLCVNPMTQLRMADYFCLVGNPYYNPLWVYYVPVGYYAPGYGARISHYSVTHYHVPANATIHHGGIPAGGGKAKTYSTGNGYTNKSGKVSLTKKTGYGSAPKQKANYGSGAVKPKPRVGGIRVGGRH